MRYAVIDSKNKVRNVVEISDEAEWTPPENHIVVQSDTLNIGDVYEGEE